MKFVSTPYQWFRRRVWRVLAVIAVVVLASLVTHYVFHRPVWPDLLVLLAVGVSLALVNRASFRRSGDGERKEAPPPEGEARGQ
jgi:hypothetical protein